MAPISRREVSVSKVSSNADEQAYRAPSNDAGAEHGLIDIAKLAHELRTPLSAIAVLAEIMRDERLGPLGTARYRDYAADILASATQANGVLASFVEPGPGSGAGAISFVEVESAEIVSSTVSALAPLSGLSGVALRARASVGLPKIIADRRCLRQMLDNLIANALKFTPPGGEIVVSAHYEVGGPVSIEVSDTGDGMTPAELERARSLEPAVEPLRRRSGGSGFGLPMVRALASASGASLAIDSEPGRGTRVTLSFAHDRVVPV